MEVNKDRLKSYSLLDGDGQTTALIDKFPNLKYPRANLSVMIMQ